MNQQYKQLDPKTIETLKAARNQVMQANPAPEQAAVPEQSSVHDKARYGAGKSMNGNTNVNRGQNPIPGQASHQGKRDTGQTRSKFAEEFVQKLASIEQEKATVDEEMSKVEKLWSSLVEEKKQLEARSNELTKVKDKLQELDKEMSDVLKS